MALLVFKTSVGLNKVSGGFDSHPPPPRASGFQGCQRCAALTMSHRVPQPPVDPAHRDAESHDFWPGFVVAVAGVVLIFCGARHVTDVDTAAGDTAWETQLIKAFSAGGLQYASQLQEPPPPGFDGSAAAAEALDRWAKLQAEAKAPTWAVRVNTDAKTPCPT